MIVTAGLSAWGIRRIMRDHSFRDISHHHSVWTLKCREGRSALDTAGFLDDLLDDDIARELAEPTKLFIFRGRALRKPLVPRRSRSRTLRGCCGSDYAAAAPDMRFAAAHAGCGGNRRRGGADLGGIFFFGRLAHISPRRRPRAARLRQPNLSSSR